MSEDWTLYADERPIAAGVYQWRVPSAAVKGLTVTFFAHMRERGAGHRDVLSPSFDHWNGYQVLVPAGTEWRVVKNPPDIKWYDYADIEPEGVPLTPCPFCKEIPSWQALEGGGSGGVVICGRPHRYNSWWLKCCGWTKTPTYWDPRELANVRNAILAPKEGVKP